VIPGCGYYFTENVGKVVSKGIEFETKAKLAPHLVVGFNASYTDAKLAQANADLGAAAGTRVPYSPRYIANVSANYDVPLGNGTLNFAANWALRGGAPNNFKPIGYDALTPVQQIGSAYRYIKASNNLSAAITYQLGQWEYSLFGTNLTNGTRIVDYDRYPYLAGSQEPGDRVYYARPRTIGVRARLDF
jgi:outer membrane receptor protein involved in Fe transport